MGLFGTDGVRGVAGLDLDSRLATSLASAGAHVLGRPPADTVVRAVIVRASSAGRGGRP